MKSEEKQTWVPLIFKHEDKILFKWNYKWNAYNFIGGLFDDKEKNDKKPEDTVKRKLDKELGFEINTDCTFRKLSDKFLFTQNSPDGKDKWYYVCHPYQVICLRETDELEKLLKVAEKKLAAGAENKPSKKMLEWFSIEELAGAKPVNNLRNVLNTSDGTPVAGAIVDILWNINKEHDTDNPIESVLRSIPDSYDDILIRLKAAGVTIGTSEKSMKMVEDIRRAVEDPFERPVMLIGETGSGKSKIAKAIHSISKRGQKKDGDKKFAADTLSGVDDENFQCILFGYAPGAFTGALEKGSDGLLKHADGGTVFLDEITTIKKNSQAIFLKTLGVDFFKGATKFSFYRYAGRGTKGEKEIQTDVRIISATNQKPVYKGNTITFSGFRDDLTSRLTDHVIEVPSLKDLESDLDFLIESLLKKFIESNEIKKRILVKLSGSLKIKNEDVKKFNLDIEITPDAKKCIFEGNYELPWNFRSLISLLAETVDNAIREYKPGEKYHGGKITIEKKHLPVFKKKER